MLALLGLYGAISAACTTPNSAARLLFQRGNSTFLAPPKWLPTPAKTRVGEAAAAAAARWSETRLRPYAAPGEHALRLQPPQVACRAKPKPACAARLVVEMVGSDQATTLRAVEGRADIPLAAPANGRDLALLTPMLLDAALDAALASPDTRPAAVGIDERLARLGDRRRLVPWTSALRRGEGGAARRVALWVLIGHIGRTEDLRQLETVAARSPSEARARDRALRWIRAASNHAGKTAPEPVKSRPSGGKK